MKLRIYLILIVTLVVSACHQKEKSTNPPTRAVNSSACEETEDFPIFRTTVTLWSNAWSTILNELYPDSVLQRHKTFTSTRRFHREKIASLLGDCNSCTDVRIYFADKHNPPEGLGLVPDLLMINANGCKDELGERLLLADSASTEEIDLDQAKQAIQRWEENWPMEYDFLSKVRAYTFQRQRIEEVLSITEGDFVTFQFAIHATPGVQEDPEFPNSVSDIQGFLVIDLIIENELKKSTGELALDFARPCPKLCDFESPLYNTGL